MIRLVYFFVSDAKLQVLGSIKNNIQKLAVDDILKTTGPVPADSWQWTPSVRNCVTR